METKSFIKDNSSSRDEEKLLYHFFSDEMKNFQVRYNWYITLAIITAIGSISVLLLRDSFYNEENAFIISGIFGIGFIVFLILLFTNKIKTQINKLDLIYLPISQMEFQNGSILVDRSGVINPTNFNFSNLDAEDISLVDSSLKSMTKQTCEMPYVLSSGKSIDLKNNNPEYNKENIKLYSEEVNLIDINKSIENAFERTNTYNLQLKAYKYNPNFFKALSLISPDNPNNTLEESKESEIIKGLNQINGIIDLYNDEKEALVDIDDLCLEVLQLQEKIVPRIDYAVHSSLNQVVFPSTFKFVDVIEQASYNYYCPSCNAELLEQIEKNDYSHDGEADKRIFFPSNTRMEIADISTNMWRCPLCEKETSQPYPKHKFEDELFTLVYDKLYEENYLERLKVYNHINDEKRKYAEKSEELFHQVIRESRSKVDTIKSKIRTVHSDIVSDEMAIRELQALMVKYKKIAEDKAKQIEVDLINTKKDIEEENRKSKERIESAVTEAKNSIDESTKKYANLEREDQAKRDAVQKDIAANTKATANILHEMGIDSGVIEEKGTARRIVDGLLGRKSVDGVNSNEKFKNSKGLK